MRQAAETALYLNIDFDHHHDEAKAGATSTWNAVRENLIASAWKFNAAVKLVALSRMRLMKF